MMMTMTVTGSCVSLCAHFSSSGRSVSFVSWRTGLEVTVLEFLRERNFCAADEKKQAYDDTNAHDIGRRVYSGTAKPARSCLSELSLYPPACMPYPPGRRAL
jgi:hypothetical protein